MSGALGYRYWPISVFPLPSLAWHCEQWSAKCSRASFKISGVTTVAHGFSSSRSILGMAMWRRARATVVSMAEGSFRALMPRRIKNPPYAIAATTTPSKIQITAFGIFIFAFLLCHCFRSIIFHPLNTGGFVRILPRRQAANHILASDYLQRHRLSLGLPGPMPRAESNQHPDHSRRCMPARVRSFAPENLAEADSRQESTHSICRHFRYASMRSFESGNVRLTPEHSC